MLSLKHSFKTGLLAVCVCAISACGFFDKDNTPKPKPLPTFTAQIQPRLLWKSNTGSGTGGEYLKLTPSMNDHAIFTASSSGTVTSTAKNNGRTNWRVNTGNMLTTGPGVGDNLVVVGSIHGNIIALDENTGRVVWRHSITGELIANPAVKSGHVVVKALDGSVTALAASDGHVLWNFKQSEPDLILRGASSPVIHDNHIITGFANGNLASVSLNSGDVQWMQQIATPQGAFAIERMIDIDTDPVIDGNRAFAASYQGNIVSVDWRSGNTLWTHDISSYTGMSVDDSAVFITDAKSNVWSFGANSGNVLWKQNGLGWRNLSSPASSGRYVIVGDAQGYLHWLDKSDGHFAGRVSVGSGILAKPLVDNSVLYALTNNGTLAAYQF